MCFAGADFVGPVLVDRIGAAVRCIGVGLGSRLDTGPKGGCSSGCGGERLLPEREVGGGDGSAFEYLDLAIVGEQAVLSFSKLVHWV